MRKFQTLQAQLGNVMNEDEVTTIALEISNTNLSDEQKCNALQGILDANTPNVGLTRDELVRRFKFVGEDVMNIIEWLDKNSTKTEINNVKGCSIDTFITNIIICAEMDAKGNPINDSERVETEWMTKDEVEDQKKAKYDKIIAELNEMDVDGEMMQYIIEGTNMNDQMLRQLILTNPQSDTIDLLEEHISLSDKSLK